MDRFAGAGEPIPGGLEPLRRRGAVEAEERGLVQVEAGAVVAEAVEQAVAPAGQAEGVPVAPAGKGQPRQPGGPRGQLVEVPFEVGQQRRQVVGGDRGGRRIRRGGADGAGPPAGVLQPAAGRGIRVGQLGGAGLGVKPAAHPVGRRRVRFPHGVEPADGGVVRPADDAVHGGEFGPARRPPAGAELRQVVQQAAFQLPPPRGPIVAVKQHVGRGRLLLDPPAGFGNGLTAVRHVHRGRFSGGRSLHAATQALGQPAEPADILLRRSAGCRFIGTVRTDGLLPVGHGGFVVAHHKWVERKGVGKVRFGLPAPPSGRAVLHPLPQGDERGERGRVEADLVRRTGLGPGDVARAQIQHARHLRRPQSGPQRPAVGGEQVRAGRCRAPAGHRPREGRHGVPVLPRSDDDARVAGRTEAGGLEAKQGALIRGGKEYGEVVRGPARQHPEAFVRRRGRGQSKADRDGRHGRPRGRSPDGLPAQGELRGFRHGNAAPHAQAPAGRT